MNRLVIILLALSAPVMEFAQSNCNKVPFVNYNVITNPSFDSLSSLSAPCTSGVNDYNKLYVNGWWSPTYPIPVMYLNSCTNFMVPDNTVLAYMLFSPI